MLVSAPVSFVPDPAHPAMLQQGYLRDMHPNAVPLFRYSNCCAPYQVQRARETVDLEIACRVCNGPHAAREGQFVLKWFLLR
jgi:hypothetical protein